MLDYRHLDWPDLVALLISDLVFRSKSSPGSKALRNEKPWREAFHRLFPGGTWGKASDEFAWNEFGLRVLFLCQRILRHPGFQDDVEDAAQGILIKFRSIETMERLASAGSIPGYLVVMIKHFGQDAIRKQIRQREALARLGLEVASAAAVDDEAHAESPSIQRLQKELRLLSEDDRRLLRMRFWKGISISQIAAQREEPYGTVASRLFRLLGKLRKRLQDEKP